VLLRDMFGCSIPNDVLVCRATGRFWWCRGHDTEGNATVLRR
jgi:hypothetical protein